MGKKERILDEIAIWDTYLSDMLGENRELQEFIKKEKIDLMDFICLLAAHHLSGYLTLSQQFTHYAPLVRGLLQSMVKEYKP